MSKDYILYITNINYKNETINIIDSIIEQNGKTFPDLTNMKELPRYIGEFFPDKIEILYNLGFRAYNNKQALYTVKPIRTLYGDTIIEDLVVPEKIYIELLYLDK